MLRKHRTWSPRNLAIEGETKKTKRDKNCIYRTGVTSALLKFLLLVVLGLLLMMK